MFDAWPEGFLVGGLTGELQEIEHHPEIIKQFIYIITFKINGHRER